MIAEMRALPPLTEDAFAPNDPGTQPRSGGAEIQASLLVPARGAADSLRETVSQAHAYLRRQFGESFEIVLIPNPPLAAKPGSKPDRSIEASQELATLFSHVRVVVHRSPEGKGAALRTGFCASQGKLVFFTDADLPYSLEFFGQATEALRSGFDFVTGNRRLPESEFDVPVDLLPLAYRRHRLGIAFNRAVRLLMPLSTSDTQAGIKAMSRPMAETAFSLQRCPGFFFDIEHFLAARDNAYKHVELPVTLYLNSEKSTVRVLRESVLAGFWLVRIALRDRFKKAYARKEAKTLGSASPLGRYRGMSLGTRLFLQARWRLTPYSVMATKLPPQGRILDLGCGHGLFALHLALAQPARQVIGLDHDSDRIRLAESAAEGLPNVRFSSGTLRSKTPGDPQAAAGISMIDVMHYFPRPEQERLFKQAYDLLAPGGRLIVREVDPSDGLMSSFNRFYEKVATATGFTRSEEKRQLYFRTRDEWEEALKGAGFEVTSETCSHPLFADILYICRKSTPSERPAR
jgi:SAM-dependent methyltransferase